jgi:pyruvate dehydrogenase E1 component alpha subunit/2-oxoisovalerate dehydrogenase E1 component alpha subunit
VGATCIGDGGTSTGAFHEALNQAAVENLPLILVVANNQYAYSTPTERQFACSSLVEKAAGYGVAAQAVDGTSLRACLEVMTTVIDRARNGAGPQMVVADLLRLCGHGEHDDAGYVDAGLKASPLGRDCLKVAEAEALREGWADTSTIAAWRSEAIENVDLAVAQVQREPSPDPYKEDWRVLASQSLSEGLASP